MFERVCFKYVCLFLSWQSIIHKSIISHLTFWRQNSNSIMYYFLGGLSIINYLSLFSLKTVDIWHLMQNTEIPAILYLFALKVGLTSSNSSSSGKWSYLIGKFMILAIHGRFISKILMDVLPLVLVLSHLESKCFSLFGLLWWIDFVKSSLTLLGFL